MSQHAAYPTPFSDVNALLDRLLDGVRAVLAHQFIGMYVHGSLALGEFDPQRSDIDFLVVTAGELQPDMLMGLESFHTAIAHSDLKWKTNCEGSYIPLAALRRFDPARSVHPVIRVDGSFGLDGHGSEWAQQTQDHRWHELIGTALGWRHGLALDRIADTLAFIGYTLRKGTREPDASNARPTKSARCP